MLVAVFMVWQLTFECLAKKRINETKSSIKPKINKEKTNFKLITEPAFLPNTCYVLGGFLKQIL